MVMRESRQASRTPRWWVPTGRARAFALGAREVILDLQGTTSTVTECLDLADALLEAGELRAAA